jgi:CubicO group peptidase (beta-lactamase class C family)
MPTLVALSMKHDRTIVSRLRVTFGRSRPTAGGSRGYAPAWPQRLASGRSWLAALITVLALAGGANAAGTSPASARLAAATDAFAAAHPAYPGVALAVVSPRLNWTGSAGHAALGARAALDPEAGFRIASVTKTFTAAAVLRLAEEGRVGLDDPIADHPHRRRSSCFAAAATTPTRSTSAICSCIRAGCTTMRAIRSSSNRS